MGSLLPRRQRNASLMAKGGYDAVKSMKRLCPGSPCKPRALQKAVAKLQLRRHHPIEAQRRPFRIVVFKLEIAVLKIRRHPDLLPVRQIAGGLDNVTLAA